MANKMNKKFITLGDLYLAYRKAKVEAYYENTHYHAVSFTNYEQCLHQNLKELYKVLCDGTDWSKNIEFLGDFAYLPKSLNTSEWDATVNGHFCAIDPIEDWRTHFQEYGTKPKAKLRLVIRPTVNYQIISALWLIKAGHKFDAILDRKYSHGNRLRRTFQENSASTINLASQGLFEPYFTAYREWREKGLSKIESSLEDDKSILAVTMDVAQFYHCVSPNFMLKKSFLAEFDISLSGDELDFTKLLIASIKNWYESTPDYKNRPEGGIPVGLSASKVIANVILADFDNLLKSNAETLYYGRYVDDIFLVFENNENLKSSASVIESLVKKLAPIARLKPNESGPPSIKLNLKYSQDSEIIFAGDKQKIFSLASAHGLDLIQQIRNQIRIQSSEYRLLPEVPSKSSEMAVKALLATPDASLQVDALRKADVISVKRLGFSLLLRDIEAYASDLNPNSWKYVRHEFYGIVNRYVITPTGFFEFLAFIPRIFGLMLACEDYIEATKFIDDLNQVGVLLLETTNLGDKENNKKFELCMDQYALSLKQAGLKAGTLNRALDAKFLKVLKHLRSLSSNIEIPYTTKSLKKLVKQLLLADWGTRPYKDYWLHHQDEIENGPPVPKSFNIRRILRLGAIRHFRENLTNLKMPHWPALSFPTRPLKIDEIAFVAPLVLENPIVFRNVISLLRGAKVRSQSIFGFEDDTDKNLIKFRAPNKTPEKIRIAVTSLETTDKQWGMAARGNPDKSLIRYRGLNRLINRILKEQIKPHYIAFPELSIPRRWAIRMARKLAQNNISLIAGIEYYSRNKKIRNDCLLSLTTLWPGYPSHIILFQPKFKPADEEKYLLKSFGKTLYEPKHPESKPTVYIHGRFCFSVLICSDLTNISNREVLRGEIDSLFIPEWNRDINTFSSLIESSATDLHAYMVQANNRLYGDSRIRSPSKETYQRDIVRLKGGINDYYVIGEIDFDELRKSQRKFNKLSKFKPKPIGYKMSKFRFNT